MEQVINVEPRTSQGKGAARRVRQGGKIPGVLYGHKDKPQPFAIDPAALHKTIKASGRGRNTVLRVTGLDREVLALLKDTQVDPVKRKLVHIDLIQVDENEDVTVEVPVELVGKPAGVTSGGVLQAVRRTMTVACKPLSIPLAIQVDVSPMNIGDTLHANDVKMPEGTRNVSSGKMTLATVFAPKEEAAATPAAETAAAEGAAPAAGAAAPADAAAKPAAKPAAKK